MSQEEEVDFHNSLFICLIKINLLFTGGSIESPGVRVAQGLHVTGLVVHTGVNFIPTGEQLRPHVGF